MKKLRLIIFEDCNRSCEGCCNKDWDISSLPIATKFNGYDELMITGGEPMLNPAKIIQTCNKAYNELPANSKIILYTAKSKRALDLIAMLNWVDGITLTLHEQFDVPGFVKLQELIGNHFTDKSLKLNVFNEVDLTGIVTGNWEVKTGMKWVKNCPLPNDEVLKRL